MTKKPSIYIHTIELTVVAETGGFRKGRVSVPTVELVAYDQQIGFTRLLLVGHRTLEVEERTDQIDHLVRNAAAVQSFPT